MLPLAPRGWPYIDFVEDAESVAAFAEYLLDRARLDAVALGDGRAVRIHAIDVGRRNLRILEREPHGLAGAVDVGVDHVGAVRRQSRAAELGENVGAARLGVVHRFEHEYASSLGQHGAVAFPGKWENAVGRQEVRRLPRPHRAVGVGSLRGADDGHVDEPVADEIEALLDGMRARRAGAADPERRPLDAALDADMRGGGRADEAHERQWVAGRLLELEDMPIGDLEVMMPPSAEPTTEAAR
jgi:hypothetical protein